MQHEGCLLIKPIKSKNLCLYQFVRRTAAVEFLTYRVFFFIHLICFRPFFSFFFTIRVLLSAACSGRMMTCTLSLGPKEEFRVRFYVTLRWLCNNSGDHQSTRSLLFSCVSPDSLRPTAVKRLHDTRFTRAADIWRRVTQLMAALM